MGKLKISKNKKSSSSKGTSGIPNWLLTTIILIVVVAVLAVCISTAIFSSGFIGRCSLALGIDDIKVNQNMFSYFFRTTYINMLSQYAQYAGDSGDPYSVMGIDPTVSLKDQTSFDGKTSWYDYLLTTTETQVENLLIYAAAAKAAGVELDDEDQKEIDTALENVILNTAYTLGLYSGGYSEDSICSTAFGEGVKKSDVRDALELQQLATKYSNIKGDSITEDVKSDEDRIKETYDEDKKPFNYVDYLSFSFDVSYEDILKEKYPDKAAEDLTDDEKDAVLKIYKEKIDEAKKNAEELAKKTSVAEYNAFVANFTANKEYAALYDTAMKDLTSEKLPSEENIKTIKDKVVANVLAEIAENKSEATDDVKTTDVPAEGDKEATKKYSIYDIEISKEYSEKIKSFKESLFSTVNSVLDACNSEKIGYYEPGEDAEEDANSWAFNSDRKENDAKTFETGDGANGAEVKVDSKKFSAQTVLLTKPMYKIDTLSRDFAYLLFTDETTAKDAIESIKEIEKLDKDKFLDLASAADSPVQAHQFVEDCVIGTMGSEKLDEWLFSDKTEKGDFTSTPIKMSDGSYMVALYVKQNSTPEWKYRVIQSLINDDYTEFEDGIFEKYEGKIAKSIYVLGKLEDRGSI